MTKIFTEYKWIHVWKGRRKTMLLKNLLNGYNLLLSLGAFYLSIQMLLGGGIFDTWPPEWVGKLPFNSWVSLALFGMIIFGIGNGFAAIWGFIKKDRHIYLITCTMGALFFFFTVLLTNIVGEWYLATGQFLLVSIIQILLGLAGFCIHYFSNRVVGRSVKQ